MQDPRHRRRRLQALTLLLAMAGFAIGCGCFAVNARVQRSYDDRSRSLPDMERVPPAPEAPTAQPPPAGALPSRFELPPAGAPAPRSGMTP
jgi:hypothetical protein